MDLIEAFFDDLICGDPLVEKFLVLLEFCQEFHGVFLLGLVDPAERAQPSIQSRCQLGREVLVLAAHWNFKVTVELVEFEEGLIKHNIFVGSKEHRLHFQHFAWI